jgi:hypothetical protein
MLKSLAAVVAAAIVAAVITLLSAPTTELVASPLSTPAVDAMTACNQQPWPYSSCVGTGFGNPKVRLIPISRAC